MKRLLLRVIVLQLLSHLTACRKNDCASPCFTLKDSVSTVAAFDTVWFINCSMGFDSILFDFGDNQYSSKDTDFHLYTYPGTYTAKLSAMHEDCISVAEKTISITGVVPVMVYGTYAGGSCKNTLLFKPCSGCSNPYNFIIEDLINDYDVRVRLQGDSLFSDNVDGLELYGQFSDNFKKVTFDLYYASGTYPVPPLWETCRFTGTRE